MKPLTISLPVSEKRKLIIPLFFTWLLSLLSAVVAVFLITRIVNLLD